VDIGARTIALKPFLIAVASAAKIDAASQLNDAPQINLPSRLRKT